MKRLFRTNAKDKSRMNFVKSDKAYTDELIKLRGLAQKYLISNN